MGEENPSEVGVLTCPLVEYELGEGRGGEGEGEGGREGGREGNFLSVTPHTCTYHVCILS